jgi:hypothetical protein
MFSECIKLKYFFLSSLGVILLVFIFFFFCMESLMRIKIFHQSNLCKLSFSPSVRSEGNLSNALFKRLQSIRERPSSVSWALVSMLGQPEEGSLAGIIRVITLMWPLILRLPWKGQSAVKAAILNDTCCWHTMHLPETPYPQFYLLCDPSIFVHFLIKC